MPQSKHIIVIMSILLSLFSSVTRAQTASSELDGVWRGELLLKTGARLTLGIQISNQHNRLKISSPNQGMYERVPTEFFISKDKISFIDEGLSARFVGTVKNNKIIGTFTQGQTLELTLFKLTDEDMRRMKFEGKYTGVLKVNKTTQLPLALNIAVIKSGYLASLDSPAQNSMLIPIDQLAIDDKALTFTSNLLGAKFSSKKKGDSYSGTFIQGMPMTLAFKKID